MTQIDIPPPPDNLTRLVEAEWPRFSEDEMSRRRAAIERMMEEAGLAHLLVYGANWAGAGVPWLTHWLTTSEAALVVTPSDKHRLFVQFHNHVPQATQIATDADVDWGGPNTMAAVAAELRSRGASADSGIGVIGPLPFGAASRLQEIFPKLVDLNAAFTRLRLVKSPEEIDWMRIGAWFSDRAMAAVAANLRPGVTERELGDCCQRAWVPLGGQTVIHFFGSTSMATPDCMVPRQVPSTRPVQAGDVVFCEISGAFQGYSGQVLRSFAVGSPPTVLYRDLHAAGVAAFDAVTGAIRAGATAADLVAASAVIEEAGFTTCDDLVHGYGGGYLPPVVGSVSRPAGPIPELTLEAGMLLVVQPNIVTRDGLAGIQTGECVLVTENGHERIHRFPSGFMSV